MKFSDDSDGAPPKQVRFKKNEDIITAAIADSDGQNPLNLSQEWKVRVSPFESQRRLRIMTEGAHLEPMIVVVNPMEEKAGQVEDEVDKAWWILKSATFEKCRPKRLMVPIAKDIFNEKRPPFNPSTEENNPLETIAEEPQVNFGPKREELTQEDVRRIRRSIDEKWPKFHRVLRKKYGVPKEEYWPNFHDVQFDQSEKKEK